ncbi:hypothetical protein KSS87_010590 [Heliosperma pusillum]|nr:hypothetical protein KSS87_002362 [Heliosperma pusillum]KAH9622802.1 hypothetical protein KSS87_010590 [Heliosperma pusillum]
MSSTSSSSSSYSSTSSTSPHLSSSEKRHWWLNLNTKKMVDRYVKEAKLMISTGDQTELNSALSQLDAALSLSPRHELALELRARSLLYLRRYKDVADMLQDYIPSYKMDDSSGSSSDNSFHTSSRERVKLLGSSSSNNSTEFDSPSCDYSSFKCFSVSDLKKRVLSGFHKNSDKEGHWRYLVLGQACCHLGLMEDAMVLLQHGKRLASAAFRRESICWSDDSFSFTVESEATSSESAVNHRQPLTEIESISHLIAHIKLLLRRRAAAMAALDAGLYSESIRHFSKILEGRRAAPQGFLAECYLHRSVAFKSAGRLVESIADLNRTLALDPSSTTALQARAGLFEMIGCITDSVHDLEHVKLLYNSILRDRTPAGPAWKPKSVPYREIPGRLVTLGAKMNQLKQRIAMGETGKNVDYYALIGLKKGCSRSELDRAHLLLALKHKPEKSISFIDRCEFSDEKDYDSVKDRARMSAVLLYRLLQRGYTNLLASIAQEAAAEGCKKAALALQQAHVQHQQQIEMQKHRTQTNKMDSEPSPVPNAEVDQTEDRLGLGNNFSFQGVFCRDLATVGGLLSQTGFNRPISVKFEALSC